MFSTRSFAALAHYVRPTKYEIPGVEPVSRSPEASFRHSITSAFTVFAVNKTLSEISATEISRSVLTLETIL